jgi:hypothetical protein
VKRSGPLRRKAAISPSGTIAPGGSLPRPSQISGGVLARDRWCVLAKFEPDHECFGMLELHHRKLRRHGDHSADNLCVLCTAGHLWVHTHVAVARAHGLLLRSTEFVGPLEAP